MHEAHSLEGLPTAGRLQPNSESALDTADPGDLGVSGQRAAGSESE